MEKTEVALFPIPELVAFPGVTVPLHIFEPRYRRLVHESVEANRMIAVSHTTKTIREAPRGLDTQSALNSNQATYESQTVFSAGRCEIVEMLADGRILAEVHMCDRLVMEEEVQVLPYRIVNCSILEDLPELDTAQENEKLMHKIHTTLCEIVQRSNPDAVASLKQPEWTGISPSDYSFKIFQAVRLDPNLMQHILESRTAHERLRLIDGAFQS
ncbi:MAG: LON peptidase substrate-binding domain-containing protein [Pseudomonadota bacterium]